MPVIQQSEKIDVLTLIFTVEVPRGTRIGEVVSIMNDALDGDWDDWSVSSVEFSSKEEEERLHDVYVTEEEYDEWKKD